MAKLTWWLVGRSAVWGLAALGAGALGAGVWLALSPDDSSARTAFSILSSSFVVWGGSIWGVRIRLERIGDEVVVRGPLDSPCRPGTRFHMADVQGLVLTRWGDGLEPDLSVVVAHEAIFLAASPSLEVARDRAKELAAWLGTSWEERSGVA